MRKLSATSSKTNIHQKNTDLLNVEQDQTYFQELDVHLAKTKLGKESDKKPKKEPHVEESVTDPQNKKDKKRGKRSRTKALDKLFDENSLETNNTETSDDLDKSKDDKLKMENDLNGISFSFKDNIKITIESKDGTEHICELPRKKLLCYDDSICNNFVPICKRPKSSCINADKNEMPPVCRCDGNSACASNKNECLYGCICPKPEPETCPYIPKTCPRKAKSRCSSNSDDELNVKEVICKTRPRSRSRCRNIEEECCSEEEESDEEPICSPPKIKKQCYSPKLSECSMKDKKPTKKCMQPEEPKTCKAFADKKEKVTCPIKQKKSSNPVKSCSCSKKETVECACLPQPKIQMCVNEEEDEEEESESSEDECCQNTNRIMINPDDIKVMVKNLNGKKMEFYPHIIKEDKSCARLLITIRPVDDDETEEGCCKKKNCVSFQNNHHVAKCEVVHNPDHKRILQQKIVCPVEEKTNLFDIKCSNSSQTPPPPKPPCAQQQAAPEKKTCKNGECGNVSCRSSLKSIKSCLEMNRSKCKQTLEKVPLEGISKIYFKVENYRNKEEGDCKVKCPVKNTKEISVSLASLIKIIMEEAGLAASKKNCSVDRNCLNARKSSKIKFCKSASKESDENSGESDGE